MQHSQTIKYNYTCACHVARFRLLQKNAHGFDEWSNLCNTTSTSENTSSIVHVVQCTMECIFAAGEYKWCKQSK